MPGTKAALPLRSDIPYTLRPVDASDVPSLSDLTTGADDGPRWPISAWADLADRITPAGDGVVAMMLISGQGHVAGYAIGVLHTSIAELEYLLVAPDARSRGFGRALLLAWLDTVEQRHAVEAFLEVRSSNHKALQLYRAAGFTEVGRRKNYYNNPPEDALIFQRTFAQQG